MNAADEARRSGRRQLLLVASIFVVTVALWMALFDALVPGGTSRLSARVLAGLALGFVGTVLLIGASPREILAPHADHVIASIVELEAILR